MAECGFTVWNPSPVKGCLGSFRVGALTHEAAVNIGGQVLV